MSFSKNHWLTFFSTNAGGVIILKAVRILTLSLIFLIMDIMFGSIRITGRVDSEYIFKTSWAHGSLIEYLFYFILIVIVAIASTVVAHRVALWFPNKSQFMLNVFSIICGMLLILILQCMWYLFSA